jgi:hypothetical protein
MVLALSALLAAVASATPPNTRQRIQSFRSLPNWSGLWQQVGVTPDATGETVESAEELRAGFLAHPPYNPEWEARARELQGATADQVVGHTTCTWGVPMVMVQSPLMFEALVTPEETAMIFSGREIRHIYTDGRGHLSRDRLFPTHWGDSIGHWEGQVLVIETIAVDSPTIFEWDSAGGQLVGLFSDQVHYRERITRVEKDLLQDELTIIDPVSLTRPWTLTRQYHRVVNPYIDRMIHEDCEGRDRNPVVNGKITLQQPE